MPNFGTLYGIGVGPGDPDLITVKAVKILSRVKHVFAAASTKNDSSTALSIARPHLGDNVQVQKLGFPMTRDKSILAAAWNDNANSVIKVLQSGENAVFLTLGDPLLYSTFGYLLTTLKSTTPDIPVKAVPGITSFQATASKTLNILAESEQGFRVISGVCCEESLRRDLQGADSAVILKAYKNFPVIKKVLGDLGLAEESLLATRVGQEGETILPLADAPEKPHYFSLVLVRGKVGAV